MLLNRGNQASAEPALAVGQYGPPGSLGPDAEAERSAGRRREAGERVGQSAVLPAQQADSKRRAGGDGGCQITVLVDESDDKWRRTVGDQERRHGPAGPTLSRRCGPNTHGRSHPATELPDRIARATGEGMLAMDGHPQVVPVGEHHGAKRSEGTMDAARPEGTPMDAARPDPANGLAFFGCPQKG